MGKYFEKIAISAELILRAVEANTKKMKLSKKYVDTKGKRRVEYFSKRFNAKMDKHLDIGLEQLKAENSIIRKMLVMHDTPKIKA